MVATFTGDSIFLADQSIPTNEIIEAAVKRVQKRTSSAKVAIAPPGAKGKGGWRGRRRRRWQEEKVVWKEAIASTTTTP